MGYRSKVLLSVPVESKEELKAAIETEAGLLGEFECQEEEDQFQCTGHDLKWYKGYTAPDAVAKVIEKYRTEGAFQVAVGEDAVVHSEIGDWKKYVFVSLDLSFE
jgi:hypothetical protein